MAKQIVDIGVQGNDGTGDSIRESFRKVNENFTELYAIFGVDGTITLNDLSDGPVDGYGANQVIMGGVNPGDRLTARTVVGNGIDIDTSNPSRLLLTATVGKIESEDQPTLGWHLNANDFIIAKAAAPDQTLVDEFNSTYSTAITVDDVLISKGYGDNHYVKVSDGAVTDALRVRNEPLLPQTTDPDYDPTLTSNYLATEAMQRRDAVYRGGDTMAGRLYLSDHPTPYEGYGTPNGASDLQAATKFYVDNQVFSSAVNLYVSSATGDDLQQKSPVGKEGRYWQYAYKTIGAAALAAENIIALANQEPGPYRQRLSYTVGADQSFSTIQSVTLTGGNKLVAGYQDAFDLLQANKEFIQAETIAYINNKYVNTFTYGKDSFITNISNLLSAVGYDIVLSSTYNTSAIATQLLAETSTPALVQTIEAIKFARDEIINFSYSSANLSSYIDDVIDALCYDLVFLSNYQSVQIALAFSSYSTSLSTEQIVEILSDLNNKILALPEVSGSSAATTSISNNISAIISILYSNQLPGVSFPALSSTSVGVQSARELLLNNITFLQSEAVAYLGAEYPNLAYDRTTCKRDVKYIVWSIVYDLMYGGNSQSVYAGKKYWNSTGTVRTVADSEVSAVKDVITYINTLAQNIIINESQTTVYQQSVKQYRNETYSGGAAGSASIAANLTIIKNIVNSFASVPSIVLPTVSAAPSSLTSVRSAILLKKEDYKTQANTYVTAHFPVINDPAILNAISETFDVAINLLAAGITGRETPTYTSPGSLASGYTNARLLAIANLDFVADETVAWIANQVSSAPIGGVWKDFTYDSTSFKRDVKYMIEAVCYDITYGGNSGSTLAGKLYFNNHMSVTPLSGSLQADTAINFVQDLVTLVIQNTSPATTYSATPQYKDVALTGGATASTAMNTGFNKIRSIVSTNPTVTVTYPVLTSYNSDYRAAKSLIDTNTATIAADTTVFLDNNYKGGFNYDEATCFRDVGYIVDAISIDNITDGTWQSVTTGTSYFRNASAKAVAIGTQYTETLDAMQYVKTLIGQVLTQTTANRYQALVTQTFNGSLHPSSAAITDAANDMDTILNIIQHGYGAAPTPTFGTGVWNIVVSNGGKGYVDQGSPGNNDIIPAKIVVGITSRTYSSIIKYIPGSSGNTDTIQTRLTKPGFYQVGEQLEFGETVKDQHITIFAEAGIYYEDYPIRLPANVSLKGDDFRRTIIRPRDRISQSPWRKIFFYRDAIIDAMELGPIDTSVDYASSSSITLGGTTNSITISLGTGQVPSSWIGKVLMDNYQVTPGDYSKRGKAIIDSVSGNVMNCSVIYPFHSVTTYTAGNWHLYNTINYGRHYLTDPLDINSQAKNNKEIDAFLCNDQTRINNCTFQGHGGFAMVLDPEGQIKTKSPYGQVCSSFSQSNNRKRFAGGQFVDGFAGRLRGTIIAVEYDAISDFNLGSLVGGSGYLPASGTNTYTNVALTGLSFTATNTYTSTNKIRLNSVTNLASGCAITFTGTAFGGIEAGTRFYVLSVDSVNKDITVSRTQGGTVFTVTTASGTMAATCGGVGATADITVTNGTVTNVLINSVGEYYAIGDVLSASNANLGGSGSGFTVPVSGVTGKGVRITVQGDANSGLDIRPPQPPCAFYVSGTRYQINDIVSFNASTRTVVLTLDTSTPFNAQGAYDNVKCSRDVGLILDAATYDLVLGSNFQSINAGRSYLRSYADAVVSSQKTQTLAGLAKTTSLANALITSYPSSQTTIATNIGIVSNFVDQGISAYASTAITYPTATGISTTNAVKLKNNLVANRAFIQAEITAWLAANYAVKNIPNYNAVTCQRDVGYIVDALIYDIMYDGNSMMYDSITAYYNSGSSVIAGEESYHVAAYGRLKTILQQIATNTSVTRSAGNTELTQTINAGYVILNTDAEYTKIGTLCDNLIDYVADGDFDVAMTRTNPTITGLDSNLLAARTAILTGKSSIQTGVIAHINDGATTVINLEMGGNKSMLANDFAMINDLGYAIVCTNGGVSEQVSTFTYYCHTHYWANNGGQIRSVAGSNAHGNYGLRASGYDVTELPDAVTLAQDLVQVAYVYKQGDFQSEMIPTVSKQALAIYIIGYSYIPFNVSEVEIDHDMANLDITRYEVSSVEHTTVTINGQNVLKLNLNTSGNDGRSSIGLVTELYHGQQVTIRVLQNAKFNNINNVRPTRPSTALQYIDDLATIYRVIAYTLSEATGELLGNNIAVLKSDSSFNYFKFVVDPTNISQIDPAATKIAITGASGNGTTVTLTYASQASAPYTVGQTVVVKGMNPTTYDGIWVVSACTTTQVQFLSTVTAAFVSGGYISNKSQGAIVGDNKISVYQISKQTTIDQINKGTYITGWNGRVHRILSYTEPEFIASGSFVSQTTTLGVTTLVVSNVAGTIEAGDIITGTGFNGTQTVVSVGATVDGNTSVIISAAGSSPSGTIIFGVSYTGYLTIDSNPVVNGTVDGTGINALTYVSKDVPTAGKKYVTFNVPWNPTSLPVVDGLYNVLGQANNKYNGWHQVTNSISQTQITVADTTGLDTGMVITSSSGYVPTSTIIQSIDSPTTFTVSPACWIPSGANVTATVIAVVQSITISNGGSGYTEAPSIVFSGGGATSQAIATCTIDESGVIDTVTIVSPGYGYTGLPTITLSEVKNGAYLTPVLSQTLTTNVSASAGVSTNQITLAYDADPGVFTAGTPVTVSAFGSKSGTGPYSVTLTIPSTAVVLNAYYYVSGNANPLYNGFYKCTTASGTVTSITLQYPYDPGTYGSGTTTITKEVTYATTSSLGISKPFPTDSAATLRIGYPKDTAAQITQRISTCRATGHDFLDIGTGSYSTTNYPYQIYGNPVQSKQQANEVVENGVGRVFYVSTDQDGIFRVGRYFTVDQGTGRVTFSASIALSNLDGIGFKSGVVVSEFSTDSTMTNNAPEIVPVQSAVRGYIDRRLGLDHGGGPVATSNLIGPGFVARNGTLSMTGNLVMGGYGITNVADLNYSAVGYDSYAANKKYVDEQVARFDQLSELKDVSFTSLADGNLAVYDNATSKWKNISLPTGDVNITYSGGVLTTAIQSGKIVNSMVSATAAIAQSKLAMTAASTRDNATGIAQADLGLASFKDTEFSATNGWITLQTSTSSTTGVTLGKIQQIATDNVLANLSGSAASPSSYTTGQIVSAGDGIKHADILNSPTYGVVVRTGSKAYDILSVTTAGGASSLVKTGSAGEIDTTQLKIDSFKAIDTTSSTYIDFYTPGNVKFMTASGPSATPASTVTSFLAGTVDVTATAFKVDEITTGASSTGGTITGQWQVLTSSQIDFTSGTLKSTTLTTGDATTAGSIVGNWSLVGASKLQATYADLAEFYEGDKDYEPGTVLVFGGDKEVTTTDQVNDTRSAGVVTTNPAYVMNSEQTGIKVCIALAGRVPCKVVGRVKKGDLLTTAATPGFAVRATTPTLGAVIGKALEDKDYGEAGVIQVAVGRV